MGAFDSLGTPVEVSAIGKELKKLWSADQTRTRATLFNFAIICEGEAAMQSSTELLENFIGSHAFRAVLIGIEPGPTDSVQAWINARCYLPKAGAKHVCSEQVSLYVKGNVKRLLPNLLFSQLDSDLPLTLLWRCESSDEMDPEIWRWVDRVIFDTAAWQHPRQQINALRHQLGSGRTVMCDLAWTRTLRLRQAIAQIFDSENLTALHHVKNVKIAHAPGARSSAVLVLGWLAAQLGWSAHHGPSGNHLRMEGEHGAVTCDLSESAGAVISRVELTSDELTVTASRITGVPFLNISAKSADGRSTEFIMPADGESAADTLNDELGSWGLHRVYSKALTAAETLL